MTRRDLLGAMALGGAALLAGCATDMDVPLAPEAVGPGPEQRRVWTFSDSHVGANIKHTAGREAADWMRLCLADVRENLQPVDFAVPLGDITDLGQEDQVAQYVTLRRASGIATWFEVAGNHDFAALPAGHWQTLVGRPARYVVFDGNTVWVLVSSMQGRSVGWLSRSVVGWMQRTIAAHQDKNVIVCTHQPPYNTVAGSTGKETYLSLAGPGKESTPEEGRMIARMLEQVRVDLWLCGHIHAGRRSRGYIARRGATTFINVAALGRMYNTGACTSYVLEMQAGQKQLQCRCRNHETRQFVEGQDVTVELPVAARFSARPEMRVAGLPTRHV